MAIFVQINAMARQNDMGREGESEARAYLVKHGYNRVAYQLALASL